MRYAFNGVAKDKSGNVISSTIIYVYLEGTTTKANIYTAVTGGSVVERITSGSDGFFEFFVDDVDYYQSQKFKIRIEKEGFLPKDYDSIAVFPVLPLTIVSTQPADTSGSDGNLIIYEA